MNDLLILLLRHLPQVGTANVPDDESPSLS